MMSFKQAVLCVAELSKLSEARQNDMDAAVFAGDSKRIDQARFLALEAHSDLLDARVEAVQAQRREMMR